MSGLRIWRTPNRFQKDPRTLYPYPGRLPARLLPVQTVPPTSGRARRPRTCPVRRTAGVRPSRVVGSGCHWCTPWGGDPPEPCRRLRGEGAGIPRVFLPGLPSLAARMALSTPIGTTSRPAGATNAASCTEPCSLPVE